MFGIWHESTTVFRALLGAFFRGLARALPWTVAGCVLLAAGTGLLAVIAPPGALLDRPDGRFK